jgi:pimeloyl-ACP methyl ester carboxylesterase
MTTRQRKADGLAIRYADSEGAGDETVLLLNPWPESLLAWETIWSRLAQTARLVAIDLPGFGESERREVTGALKDIIEAPDLSGFRAVDRGHWRGAGNRSHR